jgi:hypothetical protein
MFAEHGPGHLVSEVVQVSGNEVGQLAIFGMSPGMIDHIEVGGIGGSLLDMDPVAIEVVQEPCGFLMATEAVPNNQQWALEMAPQLLHKRKEVVPSEILGAYGEIKTYAFLYRGNGDGPSYREPIMAIPAVMHRRVTPRGPRPAYGWLQHKAGFINQDKRTALTLGFF